jgi:hypothetical protein
MMKVPHFEKVDPQRICARFFGNKLHRATLHIPFVERHGINPLCVIGQNPSAADELNADKTVRYLERYVFDKQRQYSQILMLNLYSRVDTNKLEKLDLNHPDCDRLLREAIAQHQDFLVVFGRLANQGAYRFPDRVRELHPLFAGKNVYKLDTGDSYAPHPGNRSICYNNNNLNLTEYDFSDAY